jgi:hypothetical protein
VGRPDDMPVPNERLQERHRVRGLVGEGTRGRRRRLRADVRRQLRPVRRRRRIHDADSSDLTLRLCPALFQSMFLTSMNRQGPLQWHACFTNAWFKPFMSTTPWVQMKKNPVLSMWLRKIFLSLPNRSETSMFLSDAGLIHTKNEAMLAPTRLSPSSASISTAAATHGLLVSGGTRSCRRRRSPWHISGTSIHQQKIVPSRTAHLTEYAFSLPIPLKNLSINMQSCRVPRSANVFQVFVPSTQGLAMVTASFPARHDDTRKHQLLTSFLILPTLPLLICKMTHVAATLIRVVCLSSPSKACSPPPSSRSRRSTGSASDTWTRLRSGAAARGASAVTSWSGPWRTRGGCCRVNSLGARSDG